MGAQKSVEMLVDGEDIGLCGENASLRIVQYSKVA